jgi:hypothetical protein
MGRFFLLLAAASISATSFAQKIQNVDVIFTPSLIETGELAYSESPLTWKHFKGNPDRNSHYVAMTYSGFKIKMESKSRKGEASARLLICPYMKTKQSWYKDEGHNEYTLAHEQRHFDITAIVTRQFAEEVKRLSFTSSNISAEISKLYDKYNERLREMQNRYDEETNHGIKADQQAIWDEQLKQEIRKALDKS